MHTRRLKNIGTVTVALLTLCCSMRVMADAPEPPLSASDRNDILQTLADKLQTNYVFPDIASKVSAALAAKAKQGGYDKAHTPSELAEALATDLRVMGNDKHFNIRYDPDFHPTSPDALPTQEELDHMRSEDIKRTYGIEKMQRLPGNVGYLELRGFGAPEFVTDAYTAALSILAGTDALIIDLRRNGGGEPNSVAAFLSHFFPQGDQRHLNDLYWRAKDLTQQYWTNPATPVRYNKPVYVLISPRTFSGGEECAYDFQTQKRATIVGTTTGGGANPGDPFSLGHDLAMFIPTGRAINPITHTNWEGVGVKPDIAVTPELAQQTAYVAILKTLVEKATDAEERDYLQKTLSLAKKGESEAPVYTMHH